MQSMSLSESSWSPASGAGRQALIERDADGAEAARRARSDHIVAEWMDIEGRARLIVDEKLKIYWESASAHRLFDARNIEMPLLHRGSRLLASHSRTQHELTGFISHANGRPSTYCVYVQQPEDYILLTATRLPAPWDDLVGVTLHLASETIELKLGDLNQAFGFTPAEARVAHSLLGGNTAEETAESLGVSLETVRTHIKRAYAKLGVSSREAFFHKLSPFVASLE